MNGNHGTVFGHQKWHSWSVKDWSKATLLTLNISNTPNPVGVTWWHPVRRINLCIPRFTVPNGIVGAMCGHFDLSFARTSILMKNIAERVATHWGIVALRRAHNAGLSWTRIYPCLCGEDAQDDALGARYRYIMESESKESTRWDGERSLIHWSSMNPVGA